MSPHFFDGRSSSDLGFPYTGQLTCHRSDTRDRLLTRDGFFWRGGFCTINIGQNPTEEERRMSFFDWSGNALIYRGVLEEYRQYMSWNTRCCLNPGSRPGRDSWWRIAAGFDWKFFIGPCLKKFQRGPDRDWFCDPDQSELARNFLLCRNPQLR